MKGITATKLSSHAKANFQDLRKEPYDDFQLLCTRFLRREFDEGRLKEHPGTGYMLPDAKIIHTAMSDKDTETKDLKDVYRQQMNRRRDNPFDY